MRDLKFACPHCEQHLQCEDSRIGQEIACPNCGRSVTVPRMPDEHHLRITTGKVPVPTHAHGAPRASDPVVLPAEPPPKPVFSRLAIASISLSAGSLILGPFGCIPGIIFGYLAKAQIRQNPRLLGSELARAGLIVGYCFLVMFTAIGVWLTMKLVKAH
jgi:hypothetical protein